MADQILTAAEINPAASRRGISAAVKILTARYTWMKLKRATLDNGRFSEARDYLYVHSRSASSMNASDKLPVHSGANSQITGIV